MSRQTAWWRVCQVRSAEAWCSCCSNILPGRCSRTPCTRRLRWLEACTTAILRWMPALCPCAQWACWVCGHYLTLMGTPGSPQKMRVACEALGPLCCGRPWRYTSIPPTPPCTGCVVAASSLFGESHTATSVVSMSPATDAAFCSADLVTLVGSTTPASMRSP